MTNLLIRLYNGIGDVISTLPFIDKLKKNFQITMETVPRNFDIIDYFFYDDSIQKLEFSENSRFRFFHKDYDYVLNLNTLYCLNDIATFHKDENLKKVPIQMFILGEMKRIGIYSHENIPTDFSPSICSNKKLKTNDNILVFTHGTAGNRRINPNIVKILNDRYKMTSGIKIDPVYENVYMLIKEIHMCKKVFSVDSGPVHISESTKTKWTCFLTNNSHIRCFKYYKYGNSIQSNVICSPCNHHGGYGCRLNKFNEKDCISGFDPEMIISKIDSEYYK